MTGGLLQIATYGSQDMYLTGIPEITFFKVVYRRYTNFSMESIIIPFDNQTGFGKTMDVILPRVGDLINRTYLQIILPEITIKRRIPVTNEMSELNILNQQYEYITDFMTINIQAYRNGMENINVLNITPETIITAIDDTYNINNFSTMIKVNFISVLNNTNFSYNNICFQELMNTLKDENGMILLTTTILMIKKLLLRGLNMSQRLLNYHYNKIKKLSEKVIDQTNIYAKIAWIKKLGHFIINQIEVSLGGNIIDTHNSYWIDIWYELNKVNNIDSIYNRMIGNVDELTIPSRSKKSYTLYIPLNFWFCKFTGLSMPLVASQYHNVTLSVRLRELYECLYIAELTDEEQADPIIRKSRIRELKILDLRNFTDQTGIDLEANLYVDYIFLDNMERKKFAQSSHEYLIEQIQYIYYSNNTPNPLSLDLQLNYACRTLFWIVQDTSIIKYTDGYNELKWSKYTFGDNNKKILYTSSISFNGTTRLIPMETIFTNYVVSFYCFSSTPSDGINLYSFALYPREQQPSGSCNMSKLTKVVLSVEFNEIITSGLFDVHVFALNYNILRLFSGFSSLAFGI